MSIGPNGVDYTALQAKWPTLAPGTTAQKLAALNAEVVTGSVPTITSIGADAIFGCLVFSEVSALTATEEARLWNMLHVPGLLKGGSSSTFIAPFFGSLFAKMPLTIAALTALAKATSTPWWQANGYLAPINNSDLVAAGGLT